MSVSLFTPIRIGRSDGELEIRTKKYGKQTNGPSADQLDRVANPDDYYELLGPDHPTAIEWKRVLGGMLQKERGVSSNQKWFLVVFPENYRLYKHIKLPREGASKSNEDDGSSGKSSNKVEEALLYGYPIGGQKRFKTPYEFFPHLLWLAEDKSEDYGDCACRHCAPDYIQRLEPLPGKESLQPPNQASIRKENFPIKKEPKKEINSIQKDGATLVPKVVIKQRPMVQDPTAPPQVKSAPGGSAKPPSKPSSKKSSTTPTQPNAHPLPLPTLRSQDQAEDAQYQRFIYRPGEVTWFNRGTAWGLSVVVKRDMFPDQQGRFRPRYLVQPLSHPFHHPDMKYLISDFDLRPWLAWSAPNATHHALVGSQHHFNNIDWRSVAEGRYGQGDAEVDGSIFAARMIDDSFTLMEPLSNNTTTTGERSYNAMYLGGEKIWVGEPIRLRINQGHDVMVVQQLFEKLKPGSTNINLATLHVVGDVFRYVTVPATHPAAEPFPSMAHLPIRMREDLEFRNRITIPKKHTASYWKLIQPQARLSISDVKGRWYESSVLLPILRPPQEYQGEVARGEISDVGAWINGRSDANQSTGRVGTRVKSRVEAFGKAVPENFKLSEGAENTVKPETKVQNSPVQSDPTARVNAGIGMGIGGAGKPVTGVGDGDIAEFMDLDRMEEGFARDYMEASSSNL